MLRLLPVPALSDNYVWLLADNVSAIVVDPGEAEPVRVALARERLTPTAIILTHHHLDHIGAAPELLREFSIPVYAPEDDRIPFAVTRVREGETLTFASPAVTLKVIAIPGHTLSHLAYYSDDALFCGDTLFSVGCGRLFEGTPMQMLTSLGRLAHLPGNLRVCCGHEYTLANCAFALTVEPENASLKKRNEEASALREKGLPTLPSTLADECATNPFLRTDTPPLASFLDNALGSAAGDRIARFALLRQRKDNFRAVNL